MEKQAPILMVFTRKRGDFPWRSVSLPEGLLLLLLRNGPIQKNREKHKQMALELGVCYELHGKLYLASWQMMDDPILLDMDEHH